MASVVYYQEVVWSSIFEERGDLHAQLYTRIRAGGYIPAFRVVVVSLLQHLFQVRHVLVYGRIFFPSHHQGGYARIG